VRTHILPSSPCRPPILLSPPPPIITITPAVITSATADTTAVHRLFIQGIPHVRARILHLQSSINTRRCLRRHHHASSHPPLLPAPLTPPPSLSTISVVTTTTQHHQHNNCHHLCHCHRPGATTTATTAATTHDFRTPQPPHHHFISIGTISHHITNKQTNKQTTYQSINQPNIDRYATASRWNTPQSLVDTGGCWKGVLPANASGPHCLDLGGHGVEDCLTLDVWQVRSCLHKGLHCNAYH
jgi:hypothetical protein